MGLAHEEEEHMNRVKATALAAGVGIGVLLVPLAAQAGHENTVLETSLSGANEVDDNGTRGAGDPNGRGEAYVFGIDGDPTTLCYVIDVAKISGLRLPLGGSRAAHIHEAARGVNGPVVVTLAFPQGGQSADCVSESEAAFADGVTVSEILAKPRDYYVNVHNNAYPAGAVRGQLRAAD